MKNPLLTALYAWLALSALFAACPAGAEESARGVRPGEVLPPHALTTLDQQEVSLPAREGLTVLVLWSTWSPRSLPLLKYWVKEKADYAARQHPFSVVTVNADHQEMDGAKLDVVRAYLKDNEIALPVVLDAGLAVYNEIGVKSLPTTYYLKADGTLVYEEAGFPSSASIDMAQELDRQLGIAPPTEEKPKDAVAAYVPKNRALPMYNMGLNLAKMKMREKARGKYVEALQKDPDYPDPLKALEDDFFREGRTPEAAAALRELLLKGNLSALADRYQ